MITEIRIESTQQLFDIINRHPNHMIYRGHASSAWTLQPSLERLIIDPTKRGRLVTMEAFALDKFKSKFQLYDNGKNPQPNTKLAWMAAMQHYGVPTRLLDFSESPYIALYFALESHIPVSHDDMALYAMDYSAIMQASIDSIKCQIEFHEDRESVHRDRDRIFEETIDRSSLDVLWITEPEILNTRVDKQSGTFLISGNRKKTIEELLGQEIYSGCVVEKYIIPKELSNGIFAMLRKVNITAKTLYGDLFGLAGEIRMELQVYSPNRVPN